MLESVSRHLCLLNASAGGHWEALSNLEMCVCVMEHKWDGFKIFFSLLWRQFVCVCMCLDAQFDKQ